MAQAKGARKLPVVQTLGEVLLPGQVRICLHRGEAFQHQFGWELNEGGLRKGELISNEAPTICAFNATVPRWCLTFKLSWPRTRRTYAGG